MGYARPEALLGFHINMVNIFAEDAVPTTSEEKDLFARRAKILDGEAGYNHQQSTRPQTRGVAMADSPVGAAGWILEKFGAWADLPKLENGDADLCKFSEEDLLTNIMLYVAPSAVVTATWIYRGRRLEGSGKLPAGTRIRAPTGRRYFPTRCSFRRRARSLRRPATSSIGQRCREAGVSPRWKSRTSSSRSFAPSSGSLFEKLGDTAGRRDDMEKRMTKETLLRQADRADRITDQTADAEVSKTLRDAARHYRAEAETETCEPDPDWKLPKEIS
jgi:hypothetical protein